MLMSRSLTSEAVRPTFLSRQLLHYPVLCDIYICNWCWLYGQTFLFQRVTLFLNWFNFCLWVLSSFSNKTLPMQEFLDQDLQNGHAPVHGLISVQLYQDCFLCAKFLPLHFSLSKFQILWGKDKSLLWCWSLGSHHAFSVLLLFQAGWSTSWNQDYQEKHQ